MPGTRSIESRQLCRAVPDAVTELEEAWRLNDAHPGTIGAAARLPKAPGSQKRLSEDLSSVRRMRASMPAAIVAGDRPYRRPRVVDHGKPVRDHRHRACQHRLLLLPLHLGRRRRRLFVGLDFGPDHDEIIVAVFLQSQVLSLPPCRHIICQHEIPVLDDVEHSFSSNPCSEAGIIRQEKCVVNPSTGGRIRPVL